MLTQHELLQKKPLWCQLTANMTRQCDTFLICPCKNHTRPSLWAQKAVGTNKCPK